MRQVTAPEGRSRRTGGRNRNTSPRAGRCTLGARRPRSRSRRTRRRRHRPDPGPARRPGDPGPGDGRLHDRHHGVRDDGAAAPGGRRGRRVSIPTAGPHDLRLRPRRGDRRARARLLRRDLAPTGAAAVADGRLRAVQPAQRRRAVATRCWRWPASSTACRTASTSASPRWWRPAWCRPSAPAAPSRRSCSASRSPTSSASPPRPGWGRSLGWRAAYVVAAVLAALTVVLVRAFVPARPGDPEATGRRELSAFGRPQVWLTLAAGAVGFGGHVRGLLLHRTDRDRPRRAGRRGRPGLPAGLRPRHGRRHLGGRRAGRLVGVRLAVPRRDRHRRRDGAVLPRRAARLVGAAGRSSRSPPSARCWWSTSSCG